MTIGRSIYSAYESRLLGTIIINVNVRDLQELWPEPDQNFQEKFYLVDDENRVVFSDSSEEIGGQFSMSDLSVGISSCEMEGVLYDAMVSESGHQGWKSVKMIMRSKLDKEIAVVPYMTITLVLVLIGLAVLVSLFISKIFTRPLQELYVKMRRFEAEKSGNPLPENQVEIKGLSRSYNRMIDTQELDALLLIPVFIHDFLCIHPFNDGNGRMSRLLTTLLLYRNGFYVGKYISLEAKIAKNKDLYYDALRRAQNGWHEEAEDVVPFIKYLLGTILAAYRDFEDRFALVEKKLPAIEMVRQASKNKIGRFTKQDIRELCPTLSVSAIEGALRKMVEDGEIKREGNGKKTCYYRLK